MIRGDPILHFAGCAAVPWKMGGSREGKRMLRFVFGLDLLGALHGAFAVFFCCFSCVIFFVCVMVFPVD